jgi:kynureninase
MTGVDLSRAAAATLDEADPLAGFRVRFTGTEDDGPDRLLDLAGNSLGRLPRERRPRWPGWSSRNGAGGWWAPGRTG